MVNPSQTPAATFIEADAASFRELVQRLTGAPPHKLLRPVSTAITKRSPPLKLQDRRKHSVRDLEITKQLAVKSPPVKSPATPMGNDTVAFDRARTVSPPSSKEEEMNRAISEKGFYMHVSPPAKAEPPVLLTLFPLTSPKQEF